ncbi:MAG: DUF4595 domain-containing protein [Chitinophagaceae bacterium]|nr:DUF4595 domain-containing protein [Chitinophagaceae bacterium]
MKHLFILLAVAAAFSSCKKDKQADTKAASPAFTKNLIEEKLSNGVTKNFSYNAANRIVSNTTNFTLTNYQQESAFSLKHKYNSNGHIYELKNTVRNAMGKIISADRYFNGVLQSKLTFNYNGEGFLTKVTWQRIDIVATTEMNYFYQAGNMVKITDHYNDKLQNTYLYEYDLAAANPFKLDWYEFMQLGFVMDDQFGKFSKNLVKKETALDGNGNVYKEIQFAFTLDAEGYPVSLKEITTNNTTTYTFKFQ